MRGWMSGDGGQPTRYCLLQEEVLVGMHGKNEARLTQGASQAMQLTHHFPLKQQCRLRVCS